MSEFRKASETEMEIIQVLWELNAPATTSELLLFFNEQRAKNWKIQTLSTFLSRMCEKNLITSSRHGRGYIYSPAITYEGYKQGAVKNLLDDAYGGSAKNFLAALYNDGKLSDNEIKELKNWLLEK